VAEYWVQFSEDALADLSAIERYIAEQSSAAVAGRLVDALIGRCEALASFPKRGRTRGDVVAGLRTIPHRRRVTIAYRVRGSDVTIVGFFYRGMDWAPAIRERTR